MKRQKVQVTIARLLYEGTRTTHNRVVLAGLFVGLCYLPVWAGGLLMRASQGSSGLPLIAATVYIGLQQLWKRRRELANVAASEEDRMLGHLLILGAVALFPFCRFAIWPQSLLWLTVLAGIACSSWGLGFFRRYPLPTLLMVLSVYPMPGVTARIVWQTFTPSQFLERIMALAGGKALQLIGHPAQVVDAVISLPAGGVRVDWGCNGFNMAFTMAAAGLIMGLFLKQNAAKTAGIILIGVLLALLFNVPRIMLLALASVYWGKDSFEFWHGPIGGQIFTGILFTVYYYAVMWLANRDAGNARA